MPHRPTDWLGGVADDEPAAAHARGSRVGRAARFATQTGRPVLADDRVRQPVSRPTGQAGPPPQSQCNVVRAVQTRQSVENQTLERLNCGKTLYELLQMAVLLLHEAVEQLLSHVFSKDDYAVKYAVEPLLNRDGPLAELPVRCKLLYGLGVLNRADYEDCERLLMISERLDPLAQQAFADPQLVDSLSALHCMTLLSEMKATTLPDDPALAAMRRRRYQQMIRSAVVLSVTELIARLRNSQAFKG